MRESYEEYTQVGWSDTEKPLATNGKKTVDGETVDANTAGEGY